MAKTLKQEAVRSLVEELENAAFEHGLAQDTEKARKHFVAKRNNIRVQLFTLIDGGLDAVSQE